MNVNLLCVVHEEFVFISIFINYLKHLPPVDDGDSRLLLSIALLPGEATDDST